MNVVPALFVLCVLLMVGSLGTVPVAQAGESFVLDKPALPVPSKKSAATVSVTRIVINGNSVIPTSDLEAMVASAIGRDLTIRQLKGVADVLSQAYVSRGYILARAYLPPQEIKDGVVTIAVVEGRVGALSVTGNRRYQSATILRALEPVRRKDVLHEPTLETAIAALNDYPGLKVRADLKAGAGPGLTDLTLRAVERLPYTMGLDATNYGSALTGPWLFGANVGIGNLAGQGDNLTFRGSKSDDRFLATTVGYLVPVSSVGTTLSVSWSHTENVVGNTTAIDAARPVGRSDTVSVDVTQPLTRTSGRSLVVTGGFDGKTSRNIFTVPPAGGSPLQSKDELRIFRVGLRGELGDAWLGRTYAGLTWHYGISGLGGSNQNAPQTSFAGSGPGDWHKWTAEVSRFQSLNLPLLQGLPVLSAVLRNSSLLLRASGQVASDRLLSSERHSIGGYYTVRGYPISESIGDHGYTATAELLVPMPSSAAIPFSRSAWKDVVQLVAFVDHGATFVSPVTAAATATPQVFLTGAGLGLRIAAPFGMPDPVEMGRWSLKIDWASAIGRPRPTNRDQGISLNGLYGDGAAGILYVSASMQF